MNKNRNAVACFKMEVGNIQMMLKLLVEMMMKQAYDDVKQFLKDGKNKCF